MPQSIAKFRKRCHRETTPGDAHALTFSCFKLRPFLSRDRSCEWFIDALTAARDKHAFDLWAFVVMPEHVHVLLHPTLPEYSISAILASIKLPVSRRAAQYVRQHSPRFLEQMTDRQPNGKHCVRFWQRGGGYDRNLRSPRYVWEMIDYIHDNPVRCGLCDCPTDWKWSSARYFEDCEAGPLRLDLETLPSDPRQERTSVVGRRGR
jgi:putative transposase